MIEIAVHVPGERPLRRALKRAGDYVVGRGFTADIRLKHHSVASSHACLRIHRSGSYVLDLGAADPIRRNGVVIASQAPLAAGDVLAIGECEVRVVEVDAAEKKEPAPSVAPHERHEDDARRDDSARPVPMQQNDPLQSLKETLHELVLRELDLFRRTALNNLQGADLRREARSALETIIANGDIELPANVDRETFVQEMIAEIMGYGPIEPYLADDSVSEIMVNGPERIYVERQGLITQVPARFINADSLMRVIERIVTPLGRRIDEGVPMVDGRLPDGSRVNAIIPPLSLIGPILTIRKFARQRFSMERLVAMGALTANMAEFLKQCVRYRKNIIVSGGTGSGKTTFLNALSEWISPNERIITIEDAAELRLAQPHVLSLEARPANVEGRGEVTIRDLVRNALRMRPDRIIVGECRGGEALDMLQAMNTGHDGSLTTGHANSPRDLLSRLEVMVLMAGMDLPLRAIREQIASAVDIIVQLTRFSDGRRRVTAIVEVDGMENDVILTQPLFAFQQQGIGANGEVLGKFVGFGQAPRFYEDLLEAGIALDRRIFESPAAALEHGGVR
jgi:pilus assembly protein CpaF